jgi:hypothetical protein
MRNPLNKTATWRCKRCARIFYFLGLFSVNSCPKITHLFLVGFFQSINREVLDISSVLRMKNLQDAGIDNVFFWINPGFRVVSIAAIETPTKIGFKQ